VLKSKKNNNDEKLSSDLGKEINCSDYGNILHLRGEILRQYAYFLV
jgi:hypothetical protein